MKITGKFVNKTTFFTRCFCPANPVRARVSKTKMIYASRRQPKTAFSLCFGFFANLKPWFAKCKALMFAGADHILLLDNY
jgi:hypothetical protein